MEIGIIILITLAIGLLVFLICGRLIGWALGISQITKNQATLIEQNDEHLEQLKSIARTQQRIAKNQGIEISETDAYKSGGHWTNQYK